MAEQPGLDLDAGEAVAVGREARDLLVLGPAARERPADRRDRPVDHRVPAQPRVEFFVELDVQVQVAGPPLAQDLVVVAVGGRELAVPRPEGRERRCHVSAPRRPTAVVRAAELDAEDLESRGGSGGAGRVGGGEGLGLAPEDAEAEVRVFFLLLALSCSPFASLAGGRDDAAEPGVDLGQGLGDAGLGVRVLFRALPGVERGEREFGLGCRCCCRGRGEIFVHIDAGALRGWCISFRLSRFGFSSPSSLCECI